MKRIAPTSGCLLLATVVFGCAGSSGTVQSPDPSEIEGLERQMWEHWKNGQYDAMRDRMMADAVMIGGDGITDRDGVVAAMTKEACQVESYSLEGLKVTALAPTAASISYRATGVGTCTGQPIRPSFHSSIWVQRDGAWVTAHHQNSLPQ